MTPQINKTATAYILREFAAIAEDYGVEAMEEIQSIIDKIRAYIAPVEELHGMQKSLAALHILATAGRLALVEKSEQTQAEELTYENTDQD